MALRKATRATISGSHGWCPYRALDELRRSGVVRVIGVGINEVAPCVRFAKEAAFDCFLLAGRYTLLEQNGLNDLFPLAEQHASRCCLGGPFNSGILATGATPGAKYNYKPAPPAIIKQVARIEAVCKRHDVPLAAALFNFASQPTITSIVTGCREPLRGRAQCRVRRYADPAIFMG